MTSIKFRALTHNDHKLFFEAIGEYGKDFQNIQQYMAQKCGRGSKSTEQNKSLDPQEKRDQEKKEEDKKREQIRNFYNKLYGKLSQLVGKLDDRVEKVNQELYLLINYGEIWKKHGFKFNNKTKKLLEELVNQGYTTLRFKNKNVRLRTPPCKALKKINEIGIDEKVKVVSSRELPKDVIVEFHPATNRDWLKVQSIAQNPLVRARLSIQKRVSNILKFLENKWNISQDKLNRTVDAWLKVPPNNQSLEDLQQFPQTNTSVPGVTTDSKSTLADGVGINKCNGGTTNGLATAQGDIHLRLRLRPSPQHELKEVNITRVVPDNHLDLSLNAYIKRLSESISSNGVQNNKTFSKDTSNNIAALTRNNQFGGGTAVVENLDNSQGALSSNSRLPISLTTPDSSILLERSCTSDQPTIAQARRHLNLLQTLAGSFEGCENSRTACEDTQDRSIVLLNQVINDHASFGSIVSSSTANTLHHRSANIPALFDEDAAIETTLIPSSNQGQTSLEKPVQPAHCQINNDSQNSKSADFNIPKNLTLGDWLKMKGQGGDEANDAFPINRTGNNTENIVDANDQVENHCDSPKDKTEPTNSSNPANILKPHNHMIEIEKLADGWTRQDESTMTIGELYLAFKCPEKIVLEYRFEQFTTKTPEDQINHPTTESSANVITTIVPEIPSNNTLIFKLLTTASLSLAHIERQKQEQQHKLHDQPGIKLKRRKGPSNPNTLKYLNRDDSSALSKASGSGHRLDNERFNNLLANQQPHNNNYMSTSNDKNQGQGQVMTVHDIEATNQRVEEALKQLQPTRLSVFRRAR